MLEPFYVKGETGEKDFEQPQTLWYRKNSANNKDEKKETRGGSLTP